MVRFVGTAAMIRPGGGGVQVTSPQPGVLNQPHDFLLLLQTAFGNSPTTLLARWQV